METGLESLIVDFAVGLTDLRDGLFRHFFVMPVSLAHSATDASAKSDAN